MTKNLVLLAKRRQQQQTQDLLNIHTNSYNSSIGLQPSSRENTVASLIQAKQLRPSNESPTTPTHAAQFIIYRKINSIKHVEAESKTNKWSNLSLRTRQLTIGTNEANNGKKSAKTTKTESTKNVRKKEQKNTQCKGTQQQQQQQQQASTGCEECLFCKYERVISSNKLPNFARKRLTEVFQSITRPENMGLAYKTAAAAASTNNNTSLYTNSNTSSKLISSGNAITKTDSTGHTFLTSSQIIA